MGMFYNTSHQSLGSLQLVNPCTVSEFSNLQITPWRGGREKKGRKGRKGRALDGEQELEPRGEAPGWWPQDAEEVGSSDWKPGCRQLTQSSSNSQPTLRKDDSHNINDDGGRRGSFPYPFPFSSSTRRTWGTGPALGGIQSEIGRSAAVPCFQESSKLYLNFKIISQPKLHLQSKGRLKCYDTKLYLKTMPVLCFLFSHRRVRLNEWRQPSLW